MSMVRSQHPPACWASIIDMCVMCRLLVSALLVSGVDSGNRNGREVSPWFGIVAVGPAISVAS